MTAANSADSGAKMSLDVMGVNLWKTEEVSYCPTLGYSTRLPVTLLLRPCDAPSSADLRPIPCIPKCSSNMALDTAAGHPYCNCFARCA
jgi:hypothetical protein